ncbi:transcriptional regulator [Streptomyces sp. NPDC048506]|uniref:transcriptional regulator n=1 Tax=Streptomyces sp. NPDC048506 TaxID=3155028 RepID=UPI003416485A
MDSRPFRSHLARPDTDGGLRPPPHQLTPLPRSGSFCEALRAAVAARGLSLSRLEDRLRQRGAAVTAATISAWQSGRYQPERPHALAALEELEGILGLAPGALAALLTPPKPRGRWLNSVADRPSMAESWSGQLDRALSAVDARWNSHLTCLSLHYRLEVDGSRRAHLIWHRMVLRADTEGPDRYIVGYRPDHPSPPPVVRPASLQRLGVVHGVPEDGTLAAEFLFDRPLSRGETVIVEYTLEHTTARPAAEKVVLHLQGPVHDCVIEVWFDPAAPPARCYAFRTARPHTGMRVRSLRLANGRHVHSVGLDLSPSDVGVRWDWEHRDGTGTERATRTRPDARRPAGHA